LIAAAFFAYIIYETYDDFTRLRALLGIAIFISFAYLISPNPKRINWRPVICGAVFQFLLGILFIRWPVGRSIFECFGNKVARFLEYGKDGAAFVYTDFLVFEKGIFAFAVLPTIFFFSLCISVAYYIG
jgi:nucleoside permease NupC